MTQAALGHSHIVERWTAPGDDCQLPAQSLPSHMFVVASDMCPLACRRAPRGAPWAPASQLTRRQTSSLPAALWRHSTAPGWPR